MPSRSSIISLFFCLFFIAAIVGGRHLIATTAGAQTLVRLVLNKYVQAEEKTFDDIKGNLLNGVEVRGLHVKNWKLLPGKNDLTIAYVTLDFPSLEWKEARLTFEKVVLQLPLSKEITASGFYDNRRLGGDFRAESIDLKDIKEIFPNVWTDNINASLKNVKGSINGTIKRFQGTAEFVLRQGRSPNIELSNAPTLLVLTFDRTDIGYVPAGQLTFAKGVLTTRQVAWTLQESKVIFSQAPENLSFNVKGAAAVGDLKINMTLRGTRQFPQISLDTEPPLPESKILFKLISPPQKMAQDSLPRKLSMDLTKAFVDYLFFGANAEIVTNQLKKETAQNL